MKKINAYVGHLLKQRFVAGGEKYKILYEFDVPTVVGDEKGLEELVKKNECELYRLHSPDSLPPLVRVISKTVDFTNFEEVEETLYKIDRAIIKANIRMPRSEGLSIRRVHCAIIGETEEIFDKVFSYNISWLYPIRIKGKFVRTDDRDAKISLFIINGELINSSFYSTAYLQKDSRDPEDVWTMTMDITAGLTRPYERRRTSDLFVNHTLKDLNMTNYKYVVSIV